MKIACARGCGDFVEVDMNTLQEMAVAGQAVSVAHEVCPNDPQAPQHKYHIRVEVFRDDLLVTSFGKKIEAGTFRQASEPLGNALNDQWTKVLSMTDVIDAETPIDNDMASDLQALRRQGYGICKGCGSVEPEEVLEQLEGYHSSECARDYGDD